MEEELPFRAEYAKSGRAGCKGCKLNIDKGSLRLAVMVQSPFFDGKQANWHHFSCFFKKTAVQNVGDIHGYNSLRNEDQEKIKAKLGGTAGGGGKKGASAKGPAAFCTEYAKSNRSTCVVCDNKIDKDTIRVSKKDFADQRYGGPMDRWHHLDCFELEKDKLDFNMDVKTLPGFKTLSAEDQKLMVSKLGSAGKAKKRKGEKTENGNSDLPKKVKAETDPNEAKLKDQNKKLWALRDQLEKNVTSGALKQLLIDNNQDVPVGADKILERVADCMMFGACSPCGECGGQYVLSHRSDFNGYRCTGNISGYTKCQNKTQTPSRKAFKIPDELRKVDVLSKYKYKKRDRVFPQVVTESTAALEAKKAAEEALTKPLKGMQFVVVGKKFSVDRDELERSMEKLGAQVLTKVDSKTTAVISTKDEIVKNSKKIQTAKEHDVHVISEEFIQELAEMNFEKVGGTTAACGLIQKHSLGSWGSDPKNRMTEEIFKPTKSGFAKKSEGAFTKSVPKSMKMTVKGGAAVDPESELEEISHVYKNGKDLYTAILNMVDVSQGKNSYYKLQLLESDSKIGFSDSKKQYWVFRSWGRVGTTIGGTKVDPFRSDLDGAIHQFEALYEEKTGNMWCDREHFVKMPNRFFPLDVDYGQDSIDGLAPLKGGGTSKLHESIQKLIRMIFDVQAMKKAMLEFEIDLEKMPLGKLSKKHIQRAYSTLTNALKLIESGTATETQKLDISNQFYTLIPHDFGLNKPPLLDNPDIVKKKLDMLESLLEMEIAYNLLKTEGSDSQDPIDAHYKQLKTDIEVIDRSTEEFKILDRYIKKTHAPTHTMYTLEIDQAFKICRDGEDERYKKFTALHNRQLLWHGSRTTNFAGILSQGLRIAPPEAPVTGYMFGKGVYFADMVSKSANYCFTTPANNTGLLLLCEVALGDMYELKTAKHVTKLPKGKHSVKGLGETMPKPDEHVTLPDGVVVPAGSPTKNSTLNSSLLYNEYIVYDVSQIKMKYLLQLKFNYKTLF